MIHTHKNTSKETFIPIEKKIRTYSVVICRYGSVTVEADSADAAMTIVDKAVKTDDVSWNDDWSCVDAQPVDEL